ncbi:MAG: glutathione S-transferase N-terminal domain-containing protein [Candidatus Eremiobacteraeota bacterium]|nr:glutathione S-transferase N-terminal domain-containing protein [Candidatus Eremiobacteraeota bacterium]
MTELFGTQSCPYTAEVRADLEWKGETFVEYDVEANAQARARAIEMTGDTHLVPVLVRDGNVEQIGWQGRGCYLHQR